MGAPLLGPRIGRFDDNGKPIPIPGHSVPVSLNIYSKLPLKLCLNIKYLLPCFIAAGITWSIYSCDGVFLL